jgi:hypothetical protein
MVGIGDGLVMVGWWGVQWDDDEMPVQLLQMLMRLILLLLVDEGRLRV